MPGADATRLAGAERRDALLDIAAAMVATGDVDAVSMESVADAARVSRALVYKHFANRRDLLSAVYERESAQLHRQLAAAVGAATALAGMLRALVRGALDAQASNGATFAALGHSGGRDRAHREVQRRRDRRTLRYFAQQAVKEFGIDEEAATAALGIALSSISAVLTRWRLRPTRDHAALLEETFVAMTIGGVKQLAGARAGTVGTTLGR